MKDKKQLKRVVICVSVVVVELLLYLGISRHMANVKAAQRAEEARYFRTKNEFLRTIDCAELFDAYPGYSFELKFEICAEKPGEVIVYQQNGSGRKYYFEQRIDVTEQYEEFCLVVEPIIVDEATTSSYLSFYGEYGSGVIPTVRDISIVPIEK